MLAEIIDKLEKKKISFSFSFFFLYSILFLRELLEAGFSDKGNPWLVLPFENAIFHYPLFFILSFLSLIIVAYLFTKQDIVKITNLFLLFFPIILLGPIIDLFFGGGDTRYIQFTSFSGFLSALLNYFYISPEGGVTLGILIETTIILIFIFVYAYIKTKNLFKATAAIFISYILIKSLGSLTSLFNLFSQSKITEESIQFTRRYLPEIKISLVLFILFALTLFFYFFLCNKKKFSYFIKYPSFTRIIHYLLLFNAGVFVSVALNNGILSFFDYILVFSANMIVVLGWVFAKGINDYFDKKEDSLSNKRNPFLNNLFCEKELITIYSIIGILLISGSILINYEFFFINLVILSISFLYSCPPLRLKKYVFLSHGSIALCSGLIYLLGLFLVKRYVSLQGMELHIFISIIILFFLSSHLKDIKDYEGDKKANIFTLPVFFGLKRSKIIISFLISFSLLLSVFLFGLMQLLILAIFFSVVEIYLINRKNYKEFPIFSVYFIYFLILVYFLGMKLLNY